MNNSNRTCIKCKHSWISRKGKVPNNCPLCKSAYWNKEKEQHPTNKEASVPQSLEYRSWAGMIQRCTNIKNPMYHYYGGKGIEVCEKWRNSYSEFLQDMGRRPSKLHTLDRINSLLGYFPENCRWSTREEQCRNTSRNVLNKTKVIEIRDKYKKGVTQTEIAKEYNLLLSTVGRVVHFHTWKNI